VLLKHSPRTPLCGEHYQKTFEQAGFPKNVLQSSFVEHGTAAEIIQRPETAFVSFTGSVRGYAWTSSLCYRITMSFVLTIVL
jgi:acyl-CoA reductase-like NAD-dependent aldehyde dehydrogenase